MPFWTDATGRDPKRAYRFTLDMTIEHDIDGAPGAGGGEPVSWFTKSVGKPAVSVSESSHTYLNHTFYYPGRVTWNSINVTLVDPVTPDAAAITMGYLHKSGYLAPTNPDSTDTISKYKATANLGEVNINQIDADGVIVEQWSLKNAWIKSVSLSDLDYESDALANVTLEIRYDWAELTMHSATGGGYEAGQKGGGPAIFAPKAS